MEVVDRKRLAEREFLEQSRAGDYERPSVPADNFCILPEKELRILPLLQTLCYYLPYKRQAVGRYLTAT